MNINSTPYPTTNFKARQIARAVIKGVPAQKPIELYSLHSADKEFCLDLIDKLDLKKLYPNLKDYDGFGAWRTIITSGLLMTGTQNVILAVKDKRPCGVMSYNEEGYQAHLSYLAKWRPKPDEDVSYVGKVLMHHLFDYADREGLWNINLIASNGTPRGKDCRDFYHEFGFRRSANNSMNLLGINYAQKAKQLEDLFEYEEIRKAPDIDAKKKFNISFKPTIFEQIKKIFHI